MTSIEQKGISPKVSSVSKGIAVIFMLIHHLFSCNKSCYDEYGVFSYVLSTSDINKISAVFKICVAIFVLISAYGMTLAVSKHSDRKLLEKSVIQRYTKLILNFLTVYGICIATCFLQKNHLNVYMEEGTLKGVFYMFIDALGLANFFGTPTYNETWWYMSFAILLIFAMPLFVKLYDQFGFCTVVVSAMFPYCISEVTQFTRYIFVVFLGIWICKEDVFKKLSDRIPSKAILVVLSIFVSYALCLVRLKWGYTYWVDGAIASFVVLGTYILVDECHLKLRVLDFLGKHSMNMFLVHTMIFKYYFSDFIYSFKHWIVISIALIVSSLIVSVVIDQIQKRVVLILKRN